MDLTPPQGLTRPFVDLQSGLHPCIFLALARSLPCCPTPQHQNFDGRTRSLHLANLPTFSATCSSLRISGWLDQGLRAGMSSSEGRLRKQVLVCGVWFLLRVLLSDNFIHLYHISWSYSLQPLHSSQNPPICPSFTSIFFCSSC